MKNALPVLLLKNLLVLPNQEVKLELNNELSKNVVMLASENYKNEIIVLSPKDQKEEIPEVGDLPKVAVVCKIKSKIELPNGNLRVTLRGLFRVEIKKLSNDRKFADALKCQYKKLEVPVYDEVEALALKKKLRSSITQYVKNGQGVSNSILNLIKEVTDLNKLTDLIAAFLPISFLKKLSFIEEINPVVRATRLLEELHVELEVIKLEQKLDEKLQNGLEESQKEFILKEKLRSIQEELGESDTREKEVSLYYEKLESLHLENEKVKEKIREEIKKFAYMSDASPEIANIRNYLDWMLALPWYKSSLDEEDLSAIESRLNKTHYGMQKAKEKILEYIAAKKRNLNVASPILCLIGPAGVGKTTLAKSIAESLHKEFYKISVGGLNDSSLLNGHRRTYIGACPGKIIEGLKRCGTNNPLILIDEVDKMVRDFRGDPASTLLDILDKSQNKWFIDNYIEEEFDLSNVFFLLTANYAGDIPSELYDRLEIVELSSYTLFEKVEIAKKYLLPLIYKEHQMSAKEIKFTDSILKEIVMHYTEEAGVRDLTRVLTSIIRKLIVLEKMVDVKISHELLVELLGPWEYNKSTIFSTSLCGIVNALAVNGAGGRVMPLEATVYEGDGKIKVTGLVEQVMDESIEVALSYILSHKKDFKLEMVDFKNKNLHIHMLEAGIKKDGPSAGVAITTALLSLGKNRPISNKIAMTGEISLNGFVLKIGGLKEKLIGAYNEGILKVFIPKENHNDLESVPKEVLEKIEIIEVEHYKEIYMHLFDR